MSESITPTPALPPEPPEPAPSPDPATEPPAAAPHAATATATATESDSDSEFHAFTKRREQALRQVWPVIAAAISGVSGAVLGSLVGEPLAQSFYAAQPIPGNYLLVCFLLGAFLGGITGASIGFYAYRNTGRMLLGIVALGLLVGLFSLFTLGGILGGVAEWLGNVPHPRTTTKTMIFWLICATIYSALLVKLWKDIMAHKGG